MTQRSDALQRGLAVLPGVRLHHGGSATCGIVAFWSDGVAAQSLADRLWEEGFELSVVPATSTPLDSARTGVPDLVRASVSYTTTEDEIRAFCGALAAFLEETAEFGG